MKTCLYQLVHIISMDSCATKYNYHHQAVIKIYFMVEPGKMSEGTIWYGEQLSLDRFNWAPPDICTWSHTHTQTKANLSSTFPCSNWEERCKMFPCGKPKANYNEKLTSWRHICIQAWASRLKLKQNSGTSTLTLIWILEWTNWTSTTKYEDFRLEGRVHPETVSNYICSLYWGFGLPKIYTSICTHPYVYGERVL